MLGCVVGSRPGLVGSRVPRGEPVLVGRRVTGQGGADAGFGAADRALQLHGGMGYSEEYHVSRYFRESRLMKIAPVSQEMILNFLGEHVLGLPRSY